MRLIFDDSGCWPVLHMDVSGPKQNFPVTEIDSWVWAPRIGTKSLERLQEVHGTSMRQGGDGSCATVMFGNGKLGTDVPEEPYRIHFRYTRVQEMRNYFAIKT